MLCYLFATYFTKLQLDVAVRDHGPTLKHLRTQCACFFYRPMTEAFNPFVFLSNVRM